MARWRGTAAVKKELEVVKYCFLSRRILSPHPGSRRSGAETRLGQSGAELRPAVCALMLRRTVRAAPMPALP